MESSLIILAVVGVLNVSQNGIDLIKKYESLRLEAYQCTAGKWTVGYGHTKDVEEGDVITEEQAEQFLRQDIKHLEEIINKSVKVPLCQNQFDALASLVFNIGETNFRSSTLLKCLNRGYYDQTAKQFLLWNKIKDKKTRIYINSPGLTRRRNEEMGLFLKNEQ